MDTFTTYSTYSAGPSNQFSVVSAPARPANWDPVPYDLRVPEPTFSFETNNSTSSRGSHHSLSSYSSSGGSPKSMKSTDPTSTCTLFVGDLSYVCNEERLRELFSAFGHIDSIHLKKSDFNQHRAHLSYGFVKFDRPESAQLAYQALQGKQYLGRKLRLGFADDYHPQAHPHQPYVPGRHHGDRNGEQGKMTTAQLYVTFATNNLYLPISELTLREIFTQFGEVEDVVIKQVEVNQEVGIQSGYGFVHFPLTDEGVKAASLAVEKVHNQTIQWIRFQCRFSHGLKKMLAALSAPPAYPPVQPRGIVGSTYPHSTYPMAAPMAKAREPFDRWNGPAAAPFGPSQQPPRNMMTLDHGVPFSTYSMPRVENNPSPLSSAPFPTPRDNYFQQQSSFF